MWQDFLCACVVGAGILLIPGYLVLRITRMSRGFALCIAPLASSVWLCVLSILYERASIAANPVTMVAVPTAILAIIVALIDLLAPKGEKSEAEAGPSMRMVLLYALIGLAFGTFVFIYHIDGPQSFLEEWDEVHHLNNAQAFVESEAFTFFHNSSYTLEELDSVAPLGPAMFYPDGWQVICALIAQSLDQPVTLATNATNFLLSSLVTPICSLALLHCLFEDDRAHLVAGSFACVSFAAFPWMFTRWGPVFPNLAAFSLVPEIGRAHV